MLLAFLGKGFFLRQLLLQGRQTAVFQLGGLVEVVFPLSLFDLGVDLFDFLPEFLDFGNGRLFVLPFGLHFLEFVPFLSKLLLDVRKMLFGELIRLLFQGGLLDLQLDDLPGDVVQFAGHGVDFGADHGAGFVHQVNGLVGKEPVGDVAVGEGGGGDESLVGDLHAVEDLVAFL